MTPSYGQKSEPDATECLAAMSQEGKLRLEFLSSKVIRSSGAAASTEAAATTAFKVNSNRRITSSRGPK